MCVASLPLSLQIAIIEFLYFPLEHVLRSLTMSCFPRWLMTAFETISYIYLKLPCNNILISVVIFYHKNISLSWYIIY